MCIILQQFQLAYFQNSTWTKQGGRQNITNVHYSIGNYCSGEQNKTTSDIQRKKILQRREREFILIHINNVAC